MKTHLAAFYFMLLCAVGIASGQESPYSKFDVVISPEYDHPGLGIYIEIDTKPAEFPRYLEMDVPEQTTIVLLYDRADGTNNRLEVKREDDRTFVGIDVAKPQIALRYYYNPFAEATGARNFEYRLLTNDLLPEFHVVVQETMSSTDFTQSMDGAEVVDGDFGLKFYRSHNQGLTPGTVFEVNVSYNNPSGELTVPQIKAKQEAGELPMDPQETQAPASNVTLVLGIFLGLVAVITLMVKYLGPDNSKKATIVQAKAALSGQFCTNCGDPRRPNSKFCASCGKEY